MIQQSKTGSARLLKKILIDLKENIWNYTNEYTYEDNEVKVIYSASIENLKNMAEQAILDKEYSKALTYYMTANKYIDKKECRFDVQITFLNRILDYIKENQKYILSLLKIREDDALEIRDEESYLFIKKHEMKLEDYSIPDLCKTVNNLIDNHYFVAANGMLDVVSKKDHIQKYNHIISYLKAKNMEFSIDEYENCTSKEVTNNLIQKIRVCLKKRQYGVAYKIAYKGIYSTNNPIFYYYLGKICYKDDKIKKALEFFSIYKMVGVEKYPKTQLYLYHIYLKQNYEKTAEQQIKETLEIKSILDVNFFDKFEFCESEYKKQNSEYYSDLKPYKLLRKIRISEEDFFKRD